MRYGCTCCFAIVVTFALGCGGGSGGSSAPSGPISISVSPTTITVPANQSQQFAANVTGTSNTAVTWTVSVGSAISQTGLYTAPPSIPDPPKATVTATSQADPTKSASATVTVVPGVQMVPATINVQANATQYFFLNVFGVTNPVFTWSVVGGDSNGTIAPFGLGQQQANYTAPATVPTPAQVTVKAVLQSDPTVSGTATVTVILIVPSITVNPNPATLSVFSTLQFFAVTNNLSNGAVTWLVNGVKGGSQQTGFISNGANPGLYVAPGAVPTTSNGKGQNTPTTVTVTAVSQDNSSVSGSAMLTLDNFTAGNSTSYLGSSGGNQKDSMTSGNTITCCSGTLGSLVTRGGTSYILSNNHVLARDDLGTITAGTTAGDNIIQPGLVDASCGQGPFTIIANLSEFYNLETGAAPKIDAAIAQPVQSGVVDAQGRILYLGETTDTNGVPVPGAPHGGSGLPVTSMLLGRGVAKSGRTTGLTCSSISSINTTIAIQYPKGCNSSTTFTGTFTNQIMVAGGAFSSSGDSGSLIVTQDTADPVALLFAGSDTDAAGNPVGDVLTYFQDGANAMTFVGGSTHAVIGCTLPTAPASSTAAVPLSAVSGQALERAIAARAAHESDLMRLPGVTAVRVGASQDSVGEPAIVFVVEKGAAQTSIPQEVDGIRTRIVEGDVLAPQGVLTAEQTATLAPTGVTAPSASYAISEAEFARVKAVHRAQVDKWMSKAGVQGIGIGASADAPAEAALIIFLIRGIAHQTIPATIDGVRTRVRESSAFVAGLSEQHARAGCLARTDQATKRR